MIPVGWATFHQPNTRRSNGVYVDEGPVLGLYPVVQPKRLVPTSEAQPSEARLQKITCD